MQVALTAMMGLCASLPGLANLKPTRVVNHLDEYQAEIQEVDPAAQDHLQSHSGNTTNLYLLQTNIYKTNSTHWNQPILV